MRRRRFRPKKPQRVEKPAYRINDNIDAARVFVIGADGEALGELPIEEAIIAAQNAGLDLVEVSPKAQPPVCRIADFGKIQYQKSKEARLRNAAKKKTTTKGVRIGVRTGSNDVAFKQKQVEGFLVKGNKAHTILKWVHILSSNAKAYISGTYHGIDKKHLQAYLDEFCYRFNRRKREYQLFDRLVTACANSKGITYTELTQ